MANSAEHRGWVSRLRLGAASAALALVAVLGSATSPLAQAKSFKTLHNFTGGLDGGYPEYGKLAQDKAGNLYGTTYMGGASGYGTVFKVTLRGKETVLHSFTGGADGANPYAGLVLSGNTLYGTTNYGGSGNGKNGHGAVFELDIRTGVETVVYTFTGGADGGYPFAGLVEGSNGNLYGTTWSGGANVYWGTVFEVVPKTKKETVLHSFDESDGADSYSALTLNPAETVLYGGATQGGSGDCFAGCGVVFSLAIKTRSYTVLYEFAGSSDGGYPGGTLALDPGGNLYGATGTDGASGYGTVFEVIPKTREETVLYSFSGGADGAYPDGGVIRDTKGNLYGTAYEGGSGNCTQYGYNGCGVVFKLDTTGAETVLHSFDESDGVNPVCGVTMDSKGRLYGTTLAGGSDGYGVVWEITH
jgi:uncharacterized repeat protein (TIGR03803 family)